MRSQRKIYVILDSKVQILRGQCSSWPVPIDKQANGRLNTGMTLNIQNLYLWETWIAFGCYYELSMKSPVNRHGTHTPGFGSRLSSYWRTKWSNKWWCNQHASADQTPTPCVPVASPGLKPRGGVWRADTAVLSNRTGLTWAAKLLNAAALVLGTSVG